MSVGAPDAGYAILRGMQIYLFVSRSNPDVRAFTADATGGNLPIDYAPWDRSGNGSVLPTGGEDTQVGRAIQKDGFFLMLDSVARHPRDQMQ